MPVRYYPRAPSELLDEHGKWLEAGENSALGSADRAGSSPHAAASSWITGYPGGLRLQPFPAGLGQEGGQEGEGGLRQVFFSESA